MLIHSSITLERIMQAVQVDDNLGLCVDCGAEQGGCEPDAREYLCDSCRMPAVYGAEELLIRLAH